MARRGRKRKSNILSVPDLSDVESRKTVPEDDYLVEVEAIEEKDGEAAPYWDWQFKIAEGKYKGSTLYYITSLAPQSLWNLKTLLEALGVEIPDSAFDLDRDDLIGLELNVTVEHERFEGRDRPRVVDFSPVDEEEEDEKPKRGRSSRARDEEDEEDEKPKRGRGRGRKEEPEDEEDEKPKRGRRRGKKNDEPKGKRGSRGKKEEPEEELTQDAIDDMSQEELEDLIEEHELDVDLGKFKTVRKMRAAVIDACEDAGLIEE